MPHASRPLRDLAISALLVAATLAVYAPVGDFSFLNLDDDVYVTAEPMVRGGLTGAGLRWAMTNPHGPNWHPVTTVSHMLDCELFGLDPGAHHRVSVGLHAANAVLAYGAFLALTGAAWPSAFVAGAFALHPLHVESVAWIAERKDVLSTFFLLLALIGYARYARRPSVGRYLLVATAFVLGLLAKPMLVTLPFVLLLLDAWPLARFGEPRDREARETRNAASRATIARLALEKLPLLAASAAISAVTLVVQRAGGAFGQVSAYPLSTRLGNAVVSYVTYLEQAFWPSGLAAFYPYRTPATGEVLAAGGALVAVTIAAAAAWRRRPYLLVGWLWYLGTLVPVIGIVQVGEQGMADRYTYVPLLGIALMVAWLGADFARTPARRALVALAALVTLGATAFAARAQVERWRDTETVFRRAIAVTSDNYLAHINLGVELLRQDRVAEAAEEFSAALRARPNLSRARLNLGIAKSRLGDLAGAVEEQREALRLEPSDPLARRLLGQAHDALASSLERQGRTDEALANYRAVPLLLPDDWRPVANLALALTDAGRGDEAVAVLESAVRRWPDVPALQAELARAGRASDAGRAPSGAAR